MRRKPPFFGGEKNTIRTWQLVTVVEPSSMKKICEPSKIGAIFLRRGIGGENFKNIGNHHLARPFFGGGRIVLAAAKNLSIEYLTTFLGEK